MLSWNTGCTGAPGEPGRPGSPGYPSGPRSPFEEKKREHVELLIHTVNLIYVNRPLIQMHRVDQQLLASPENVGKM